MLVCCKSIQLALLFLGGTTMDEYQKMGHKFVHSIFTLMIISSLYSCKSNSNSATKPSSNINSISASALVSSTAVPVCGTYAKYTNKNYLTGDIVLYTDGKNYIATHDNPGYDPIITYYWSPYTCTTPVASIPVCGTYAKYTNKNYVTGDIVLYTDGKNYIATHNNPGYDPIISTYYWSPYNCSAPVASCTTKYPVYTNKNYVIGDIVLYSDGKNYIATHNNPGYDPIISTYYWSSYTCSNSTTPVPTPTPTPTPTPVPVPAVPVITALSCSFANVSAAVNTATAAATIVKIPAGDCNWGTQQLNVPGGVYLQGAGQDVTTIRRVGAVSNTAYLVAYNCSNGKQAIFSNMTLVGNGNGSIQDKGLGLLNGCVDFKVSNSKFTNFIFSAVYVGDSPGQRGVIFNNSFINNFSASLMNLGYGVAVYGGGAWPALDLGSKNAVFVESNYFSGNRHNIASNNGSVYVFRYNTVVGLDPAKDFAMSDAHGLSSSPRGSRSYEIYNNNYSTSITSGLQRSAIGIRGGDGVIFNNTATATISRTIELMTEGFSCGTYPGADQIRSLYIWNNSNNSQNGYTLDGIDNTCPASIGLNRDYFLTAKPGYVPYTYPHPLR